MLSTEVGGGWGWRVGAAHAGPGRRRRRQCRCFYQSAHVARRDSIPVSSAVRHRHSTRRVVLTFVAILNRVLYLFELFLRQLLDC